MKSFLFALTLVASLMAHANSASLNRVTLKPESLAAYTAGKITYKFQILDSKTKKPLLAKDLQDSHTQKLHLVAYDPSLREFNHVHPEFDGKAWSVDLQLPVDGKYFVWVQGTLNNGTEFSAKARADVSGGKPAWPVAALGDHRKASDRNTVIELEPSAIQAKKTVMANFTVSRDDGQEAKLEQYLAAFAHVIAVSPNGEDLIHVHPMEGAKPTTGMLHASFPSKGDYRIWVQLIDRSEIKTIPLSVTVK